MTCPGRSTSCAALRDTRRLQRLAASSRGARTGKRLCLWGRSRSAEGVDCSGGHVGGCEWGLGSGDPAAAWGPGQALEEAFWGCLREGSAQRRAVGQEKAAAAQAPLPRPTRRAGPAPRPSAARPSPASSEALPRQRKVPGPGRAVGRSLPHPAEARWRNAGTMRHLSPPGRAAAGSAAEGADLC